MTLFLSVGYVEHPADTEVDLQTMELQADQLMYQDKERYCSMPERDRRRRRRDS